MHLHYVISFLLCVFYTTNAVEYIYPIACLNDETIVYIHQTDPQHIQLYSWNYITDTHEPMLCSMYNPAGVQLLPNNAGFSFIDNGRLRIKLFAKRSPKAIDFDEPIFNINGLQWIDEHTCCCSAQWGEYFSLFELHDDGRVQLLVWGNHCDCMYLKKINENLFFVKRTKRAIDDTYDQFYYSIEKTAYGINNVSEEILDFKDQPIIFLNMVSEREGFVVGHEKSIDSAAVNAQFHYYHLINNDGTWHKALLFSFMVPTNLFLYDNENRLFESILPLLPRIIDGIIYFVDCSHSKNHYLEIYCCDMKAEFIYKGIAAKRGRGHLFVPLQPRENLCVGGGVNNGKTSPLFIF